MALSKQQTASESMSDEELVNLARGGSESAFSILIHRCALTVKYQIASLKHSHVEDEDLAQEGLVGLLSAVRTYKSGVSSFRTYASACIRNRMLSAVRGSAAARVFPQAELVSIDDSRLPLAQTHSLCDDPEQLVVQKDEIVRMQKWLRGLLSPKEYKVFMMYLGAYSYEEISQRLGISVKAVDNSLQRVRRKLVAVSFPR